MSKKNKWMAIIAGIAVPAVLVFAYATGPDPRHTGAPGESDALACATAGCHTGTALNGGGGSVVVNFQNGQTYTPGAQQTFTIVITDSVARVYGFQMTARLESDLANGQAGDFTASAGQIVLCDNNTIKTTGRTCSANAPVQFIEHSDPSRTNTFVVKWTAPASSVGNVHLYVAGNAANGDANNTGDHIYSANYVLTPPAAANPPTIAAVQSAGGFNASAGLAPGTWLEIYGTDLSSTTRGWAGSDFTGVNAPTSLDQVKVTVDGKPAFVDFISSGQVNVQAPEGIGLGPGIQIVLSNSGVQSNAFTMTGNSIAPALLAPPSFNTQGHQWVVAQYADQTYVGKVGLVSGLTFRPAKAGDTIVIYGIGFGPVTPSTPAGTIATQATALQTKPNFRFGQTPANVSYYGLAPNFVGLYQFNITVPNVTAGDMQLSVDVGGVTLDQNCFITVSQ